MVKPKRALVIVGNMDGSLNVDEMSRDDAYDVASGLSNMERAETDAYENWITNATLRTGDSFQIQDETGDVVAVVVLL